MPGEMIMFGKKQFIGSADEPFFVGIMMVGITDRVDFAI
jgi:hypothetical protein